MVSLQNPAGQLIFHLQHGSLLQTISLQFGYKNTLRNHIKTLVKQHFVQSTCPQKLSSHHRRPSEWAGVIYPLQIQSDCSNFFPYCTLVVMATGRIVLQNSQRGQTGWPVSCSSVGHLLVFENGWQIIYMYLFLTLIWNLIHDSLDCTTTNQHKNQAEGTWPFYPKDLSPTKSV